MDQASDDSRRTRDRRTGTLGVWLCVFSLRVCGGHRLCTGGLDPDITHSVVIERVDSPQAQIESVHVRDHAGHLAISGRLHKRYHGRSPVPGRLYVEVMDKDGALLSRAAIPNRTAQRKDGNVGVL